MTTKLSLYNNALTLHLGERKLSSLTENRKPRRVLDQIWDSGFVRGVLEDGQWNFATATIQSSYNPDITPAFGMQYAHDKPSDWCRTIGVSTDSFLNSHLLRYEDQGVYIFTESGTIYLRYISDGASHGGDLTLWPQSMTSYAELKLASLAAKTITQSDETTERLRQRAEKEKRAARSMNDMNNPTKFLPMGSWARSRGAGSRTRFPDGSLGSA